MLDLTFAAGSPQSLPNWTDLIYATGHTPYSEHKVLWISSLSSASAAKMIRPYPIIDDLNQLDAKRHSELNRRYKRQNLAAMTFLSL